MMVKATTAEATTTSSKSETKFQYHHSLMVYCLLCFAISWGGVAMIPNVNFPAANPEEAQKHLPMVVLATLAGPSISGIIMKGPSAVVLCSRKRKKRRCAYTFIPWIFAPMIVSSVLAVLHVLVPGSQFVPVILMSSTNYNEKLSLIGAGLAYGAAAGIFEEVGWTAFAVQETRKNNNNSTFRTGIIVGIVWGLWHTLVAIWGSGTDDGKFSWQLFIPWIPWNFLVLPAYRVLMVCIYDYYDEESIVPMAIMHGSLTASLPLILAPSAIGLDLALFYTTLAVAIGCVIKTLPLMIKEGQPKKEKAG